jgi:hypothetical protein
VFAQNAKRKTETGKGAEARRQGRGESCVRPETGDRVGANLVFARQPEHGNRKPENFYGNQTDFIEKNHTFENSINKSLVV